MKGKIIEAHLMDEAPKIGSGHRLVVAIIGRKHVRLFCPATLSSQQIGMETFKQIERAARTPRGITPKKLARQIRARAKKFEELGVGVADGHTKKALAALKRVDSPSLLE